ncbi:putative TetR family regulatory protein [Reticulibacter mediterranei]|uniref:Putative TetR family regulatory protein n=1 Tax=Reticulibacter mediterranei TaxID=2778369 RepID=A0A8J3IWZ4_9CHLR|nr:TetR family transcriptional regulator [Reticulibacter mediterranei]GHO97591.1 putative TetR family regulatory protein [Reticulibacter mediterranei]
MSYDSAATRRRILDAAYVEFADRGFANARVNRIAAQAKANKQAIYLYFESKEGLFDAVLENRLGILADMVSFTPDNLTGYIGALFDYMVEHPNLLRLTHWKSLERPEATKQERESHLTKASELAEAVGVDPARGMDIFMLTLAMAQAWNTTATSIRESNGSHQTRLKQHREALIEAVTATVNALT